MVPALVLRDNAIDEVAGSFLRPTPPAPPPAAAAVVLFPSFCFGIMGGWPSANGTITSPSFLPSFAVIIFVSVFPPADIWVDIWVDIWADIWVDVDVDTGAISLVALITVDVSSARPRISLPLEATTVEASTVTQLASP